MYFNKNVFDILSGIKSRSIKTLIILFTLVLLSSNAHSNIDFEYTFGGSERFDGNSFRIPSGAMSWAGFSANMDFIGPFNFPNGGTVTFNASLVNAGAADLRFKFEKNAHPDTEPSFYTNWVTIDSVTERSYAVNIPAQPSGNSYAAFLLYLELNKTFIITDIVVTEAVSDCQPTSSSNEIFIEAECFASTTGVVQVESTSDVGGGENVGYIDRYDSMLYAFTAIQSGNYRLNYRVASPAGSIPGFNVNINGSLVDVFSVPATNGWQNWQTVVGRVLYLDAGDHSLMLDANAAFININWISLTKTNDEVDTSLVDDEDNSNWQPVDSTKWFHQTQLPNGWGWYNDEQQHYTDELENSYISNGTLKIVAKRENYFDQGHLKPFTSARLNSKFAFKYGKVEFKAKMPWNDGSGSWPAVWMLNRNISEPGNYWATQGFATTSWPAAGEIDILEHWSKNYGYAQSAMHTTSSSGDTVNHGGRTVYNISSQFHTYSMDWNADRIIFKIDGQEHYRYNPTVKNAQTWPYDDHFFLLLNVAIEKEEITSNSLNISKMEVDYIRVYHHETNELLWSDEFGANDSDDDGVADDIDAFPNDPTETIDTDSDGIGNNADTDDDGDGAADSNDAFPLDSTESLDTDSDGIGNNTDNDDDNDGTLDANDALPLDATETLDTDLDGIGNNSDTDDDGDGVADSQDAFPLNSSESLDTDNDGIGNNTDADDDGDGILDADDTEPLNPNNYNDYQVISVSNTPSAARGRTITLDLRYDVTSNENQLTGLGLRLHYDSSKLEFAGVENVLTTDNIINGDSSQPDDENFDSNTATDRFVPLAWASLFGNWPNVELPTALFSITFNVGIDVAVDSIETSTIGFSKSSNATGYGFSAAGYELQIMPATWDFDSNGTADALTDGLLLLRHAFGLNGEALTGGAIASDSTMSSAEVEQALSSAMMIADIDDNGSVDALTDGLLLLRYLFGLRDEVLISGAVSTSALRSSHSDISDYIMNHMPDAVTAEDITAPQITLNSDAIYPLAFDVNYIEPGAIATDDRDGEIEVTVSGVVGSAIGSYDVTYTATDSAGNSSSATRTVIVDVAPTMSSIELLSNNNPSLNDDIILEMDGTTFSGRVSQNIPVSDLYASFTHDGATVFVADVEQTSGSTPNDFTELVEYKVSKANGVSKTFTVDLTKFTGLPIVSIQTDGNLPIESKDDYITGTVTIDGGRGFNDLDSTIMEIRGRGNSTWGNPKKPYQMKLDSKEEFLDMPKQKKWLFLAEYSDKSLLRNTIAFELGYLSNLDWTPKSEFAEVYINGEYNGTYNVSEKVEEKSARVDIGDEGFLLEKDTNVDDRVDPDDVYFNTIAYQGENVIVIKDPGIDRLDANDFAFEQDSRFIYIRDYINSFEAALFGDDFKDPVIGYASYIDNNSFIDWFLINEISKNVDSRQFSSIYFTHIPGDKIKMGPLWDFDLGFGNMDYGDPQYAEGWHVRYHAWISRLLDDPAFVTQVQNRFTNHYLVNKQYILDKIDEQAELLKWAQQENFNTWQILGVYVWPNPYVWDTYEEEVLYLKTWYEDRMDWLEVAINSLAGESEGPVTTPDNVSVTFQVDMNSVETNAEGVYLAGGDLGQAGYLMTDNGNDVWSVTLELGPNFRYHFKFRNQPSYGTWDGFESGEGLAAGDCGAGEWSDRFIDVGINDITLDIVAYGSCTSQPY
jgi:beta-glucanase (GH16 family)